MSPDRGAWHGPRFLLFVSTRILRQRLSTTRAVFRRNTEARSSAGCPESPGPPGAEPAPGATITENRRQAGAAAGRTFQGKSSGASHRETRSCVSAGMSLIEDVHATWTNYFRR